MLTKVGTATQDQPLPDQLLGPAVILLDRRFRGPADVDRRPRPPRYPFCRPAAAASPARALAANAANSVASGYSAVGAPAASVPTVGDTVLLAKHENARVRAPIAGAVADGRGTGLDQTQRELDASPRVTQLRNTRQMLSSTNAPVQRAVGDDLERGDAVRVVDKTDENSGQVGTIFSSTETGYEIRFPKTVYDKVFKAYTRAQLDLEVVKGWTSGEMHGLRWVAHELLRRYSPAKFAYVALGSSPLLFMEYVRKLAAAEELDVTALDLPISEVDDEKFLDLINDIFEGGKQAEVVETQLENLDKYLSGYVAPGQLDGKWPLLIDYAAGGRTLAVVRYHLMAYYSYEGYEELAQNVYTVALNSGKEVISPTSSYGDIVSYLPRKQEIADLFGKQPGEDLEHPQVPTIDPEGQAKEFLAGLSNRKLKDELGYRNWDKTGYGDVLAGREKQGRFNMAGATKARKDVAKIFRQLG